ncbi:DUF6566 family protein [Trinickia diaoshuihuensis]|uniref:DUF6566 family protein n=1 Tax=Trinickia diaoshuihuensis TaxID=2292265 RepID=UPI000E26F404|nr:DUF6566 family protein [Trinickia diaoshuihuensis]
MDQTLGSDDEFRCYEYRGYNVTVSAEQGEREQWLPNIEVTREGQPVELDAPEGTGPYWATRREALQAGLERARYLLDKRDRTPLDLRNPAR